MEIEENNNPRRRRWSGQFTPAQPLSDTSDTDEPEQIESDETSGPRRSLRRRIRTSLPETCKTYNKPKKLTENSSLKDIKNYYLDRNVKILNPSLETIFEEPQQTRDEEEVMMSSRKYRRSINFKATSAKNPSKIKKRKLKAKQVLANKRHKKVPLQYLMEKLAEISDE